MRCPDGHFVTLPPRPTPRGLSARCSSPQSALAAAFPAAASARPGLTQVSATTPVDGPTGTTASATARCPAGTRAISGGYDPTNVFHPNGSGTALLVNTSRRLGPRAWKVTAYQLGGGTRSS